MMMMVMSTWAETDVVASKNRPYLHHIFSLFCCGYPGPNSAILCTDLKHKNVALSGSLKHEDVVQGGSLKHEDVAEFLVVHNFELETCGHKENSDVPETTATKETCVRMRMSLYFVKLGRD